MELWKVFERSFVWLFLLPDGIYFSFRRALMANVNKPPGSAEEATRYFCYFCSGVYFVLICSVFCPRVSSDIARDINHPPAFG